MLLVAVAGCGDDAGADANNGGERDVADGVIGALVSDGTRAYLSSSSLGSFLGYVTALSPSGDVLWTSVWPGGAPDLLVAPDGLIYASGGGAVSAFDASGRRLGLDGEAVGSLAWHPWGLPMTFGDGILVLDRFGAPLLRGLEAAQVHHVASTADGFVYATVTERAPNGLESHLLYRMNARLEPIWTLALQPATGIGGLGVHDDFVVVSSGTMTEARAHNGDPIWAIQPFEGDVQIAESGTTYLGGRRRIAVSRDGEILWDIGERTALTLTDNGLAAMILVQPEFGSLTAGIALINPATGEAGPALPFDVVTDFVPPVVVQGRLLGAVHRVEISQGTIPGGDISVSQSATTTVRSGPAASPHRGGWPSASGPNATRALPTEPVVPAEEDLWGLWAALRDDRVRALGFVRQAPAFGLFDGAYYGIWDYNIEQPPRLVQMGRWSLVDDVVELEPIEEIAGVEVRESLRLQAASPGVLRIDDPLQDVVRPFLRAADLPGNSALPADVVIDWIDDSGARRGEWGSITQVARGADGARWAVTRYNATGYFGDAQFSPDNITVRNGVASGNLINEIVARIDSAGNFTNYFHNEALGDSQIRALVPDGDGVIAIGPLATGAFERTEHMSVTLRPGPDRTLVVAESVPWFGPDELGHVLPHHATFFAGRLESGDVVFAGRRMSQDDADDLVAEGRDVIVRASREGAIAWETDLDELGEDIRVQDAVANEGDLAVYVAGTAVGAVAGAGADDGGWNVPRAFVARLSLVDGQVEALELLGAGSALPAFRDTPGFMAARPDGGFVHVVVPDNAMPYNAGTGGQGAIQNGTSALLIAYGQDLRSRWSTPLTEPSINGTLRIRDVAVDDAGVTTVVGGSQGLFFVDGRLTGRADTWSPILQFSPCGRLLEPRRFAARMTLQTVLTEASGRLLLGGFVESDIFEPPFVIPWAGILPTSSSPYGNTNNLIIEMTATPSVQLGEPDSCIEQPRSQSTVTVKLDGTGTGRVVSEPPGINCPGQCSAEFDDLTRVELFAEHDPGHMFSGFRAEGMSLLRCEGIESCEVLVTGQALVHAYFDAVALDTAYALPLDRPLGGDPLAIAGDRAAATVILSGPVATASGMYDPATDGGAEVLLHLDANGVQAVSPLGRAPVYALAMTASGDVALVASIGAIEPYLDERTAERTGIAVFAPDGSLRWARPLPNRTTGNTFSIAANGSKLGVIWYTDGAFELDGIAVDAEQSAFAMFEATTGQALAAHSLQGRAREVLPNGRGGFTVSRLAAEAAELELPAGVTLPAGATGPVFVAFDDDGELVAARQAMIAETYHLAIRSLDPSASDGYGRLRLDDDLHVTLAVFLGSTQAVLPQGALAGDVPVDAWPMPLVDPEAVRASVAGFGNDAVLRALWTTPTEDEVSVLHVAADGETAVALVAATRLRAPDGAVLLQDAEHAVVFLRTTGVGR